MESFTSRLNTEETNGRTGAARGFALLTHSDQLERGAPVRRPLLRADRRASDLEVLGRFWRTAWELRQAAAEMHCTLQETIGLIERARVLSSPLIRRSRS